MLQHFTMDSEQHIYVTEYPSLQAMNEQRGHEILCELRELYEEQVGLPELLKGSVLLRPSIMNTYAALNNRAFALLLGDMGMPFRIEFIRLCNYYFEAIVMNMK